MSNDEIITNEESQREDVEKWLKKIEKAEKEWKEYHTLVEDIRKYYKNDKKRNKQNIFWSSIETLKPFIYFKQPTPYVDRKEKAYNPVQSVACKIIEKAIAWDMEQYDFDGVIKYVRNDFLLSGLGLAYEKYKPTFKVINQQMQQVDEMGNVVVSEMQAEVLDSETVETIYIDPVDFIADSDKVGIWEDCTWWARVIHMTRQEVVEQFGEDFELYLIDTDEDKDRNKSTNVYEIYDKADKKIYYICKDIKGKFLKVSDDVLGINGFYPMPKPLFATTTNETLIPVPDYTQIKSMLDELDGITSRMKLTMQALKVSGAYDNSFPELKNILDKDTTLVALSDFDKLKEAGGIKGIIDFAPIEQYITALQSLAQERQDVISRIYEITGVSDIMRGNSDPNETATAVTKKTNFGTLRNQDRQNDMQRFIRDLLRIKAEIICEQFTPETLMQFVDENTDPQIVMQAIELLKTDKLRGLSLGIETDTTLTDATDGKAILDTVSTIHNMIVQSAEIIESQPLLMPLYQKMVEAVVISLPNARQFEPVIEQSFEQIQQILMQPEQEQPNPELLKVQNEASKNQADIQIKQEQNQIKREELALKKQVEDNKVMMTNKEAEMQYDLKQQEIQAGLASSANITTGYVKGF
ncbi:MAG: hypothetical protein KBT03_13800 [Bacteroidales bacterium]|nr:hypothetical protein [Candidatus Scybalousia scybalohippi]